MTKKRVFLLGVLSLLASAGLAACGGEGSDAGLRMAPLDEMPQAVQDAPKAVRESYRFAIANPEVLRQLPCYCGCGGMGHTSNYSCYASTTQDGALRFDGHALGCSICVDITLDAVRLLEEGRDMPEIRAYVDAEYSRYGPSNMLQPDSLPL